ncbi:hypothetical protein ACFPVY_01045 [Flavobacterium qiangtangense]|uniref:Uncharacterized protein n=1 Tax=Flavobacterium qiangtangense TaxID=1442595 RepID=A0ABW1PHW4_9FLAO
MTLKIPADKAIEILKKRKTEINNSTFEPEVWKGKTENDLQEIFGILDGKKFQISSIRFTTPFTEKKYEIFENGKRQAEQFLESYIEQIEEYSKINQQEIEENDTFLKIENTKLKSNFSDLLVYTKQIEKKSEQLLKDAENKNQKISSLEKNTVQLTDVTIKKILYLIYHLPIGEVITVISIFIGIICFSFWAGTTIQDNSNKSEHFNLNKKVITQSDTIRILIENFKSLSVENKKIKKELDSIKNIKKTN